MVSSWLVQTARDPSEQRRCFWVGFSFHITSLGDMDMFFMSSHLSTARTSGQCKFVGPNVLGRHRLLPGLSQHRTWRAGSCPGSTGHRSQGAGRSRSPPGDGELEARLQNRTFLRPGSAAVAELSWVSRQNSLSRVEPQPVMVHMLKEGSGADQMSMGLTRWLKSSGCWSFSRDRSFSLVRVL